MFIRLVDSENRLAIACIMRDAGYALVTRCDTEELLTTLKQALGGMRVSAVIMVVRADETVVGMLPILDRKLVGGVI